jgi:hypothetical protein
VRDIDYKPYYDARNIGLRDLFRIQILVRDKILRMCQPETSPPRAVGR